MKQMDRTAHYITYGKLVYRGFTSRINEACGLRWTGDFNQQFIILRKTTHRREKCGGQCQHTLLWYRPRI